MRLDFNWRPRGGAETPPSGQTRAASNHRPRLRCWSAPFHCARLANSQLYAQIIRLVAQMSQKASVFDASRTLRPPKSSPSRIFHRRFTRSVASRATATPHLSERQFHTPRANSALLPPAVARPLKRAGRLHGVPLDSSRQVLLRRLGRFLTTGGRTPAKGLIFSPWKLQPPSRFQGMPSLTSTVAPVQYV